MQSAMPVPRNSWSDVGRGEGLVDPDEPFILVGGTVTAAIIARKRTATP